jgi:hypothetical protein
MSEENNIRKKLQGIQSSLKAPKGQVNKFGGYSYRSAEDILNAVKPLLNEWNCTLVINDDIVQVGDRHYVKANATLACSDSDQLINAQAFAREAVIKKGMDEAQITGSASSYARKYALNALFALDDTKDPDATNTHGKEHAKKTPVQGF